VDAAHRIVVLSGAGLSAESGVPVFRGAQGLWKTHRPEDLATPEAFRRDPRLVWEWYAWRRQVVFACAPNEGHRAIARRAAQGRFAVVTQNVDGLHARARAELAAQEVVGYPLLELHGALQRDRCSGCGARSEAVAVDGTSTATLPRCVRCGSLLRPDVVWFGESLDLSVLDTSFRLASEADVCLVVGTSAVVHPAASIPLATRQAGGVIVEVNPEPTPLSRHAAVSIAGRAADVLPRLLD